MRIALIPVKELSSAKTRLSPLLDDDARRALTLAMYRDALEAAREAGLSVEPLDLPGLALDIDTPADLERLRGAVADGQRAGRRTLAMLLKLNLVSPPVQEGKRR